MAKVKIVYDVECNIIAVILKLIERKEWVKRLLRRVDLAATKGWRGWLDQTAGKRLGLSGWRRKGWGWPRGFKGTRGSNN